MELHSSERWHATVSLEVGQQKKEDSRTFTEQVKVLAELHGGFSAGHLAVEKITAKVRQQCYWLHSRSDVERWHQQRHQCSKSRSPNQEPEPDAPATFERIATDNAAPFPEIQRENWCLLIAVDNFPKWPEVYAIPNQEA
jgi:hypothetical protein